MPTEPEGEPSIKQKERKTQDGRWSLVEKEGEGEDLLKSKKTLIKSPLAGLDLVRCDAATSQTQWLTRPLPGMPCWSLWRLVRLLPQLHPPRVSFERSQRQRRLAHAHSSVPTSPVASLHLRRQAESHHSGDSGRLLGADVLARWQADRLARDEGGWVRGG